MTHNYRRWLSAVPFTLAFLAAPPRAHAESASIARTVLLSETGHLQPTSHGIRSIDERLDERGSAAGTIAGRIYIHLQIVAIDRVTAEVSIYPSNGSLSGQASASYHVRGGIATFSGCSASSCSTGRSRSRSASRSCARSRLPEAVAAGRS
jgi:hypothetical protein